MTATIKYHKKFSDYTIFSYFYQWTTAYGDLTQDPDVRMKEFSIYSGGTGTNQCIQAAYQSVYDSDAAVIISGKIFGNSALFASGKDTGNIEGLEFGESVIPNSDPTATQHLQDIHLKFSGLDINGDYLSSMVALFYALLGDDSPDSVKLGTYNLLRSNPGPMLEILKDHGIDMDIPLKEMAIASQFDDVIIDVPIIDTVGTSEGNGILLAA
jgi:heme acquisition protein HasA